MIFWSIKCEPPVIKIYEWGPWATNSKIIWNYNSEIFSSPKANLEIYRPDKILNSPLVYYSCSNYSKMFHIWVILNSSNCQKIAGAGWDLSLHIIQRSFVCYCYTRSLLNFEQDEQILHRYTGMETDTDPTTSGWQILCWASGFHETLAWLVGIS